MTNLKEARKTGKIDKFIKEHSDTPKGDAELADRTLEVMAKKSRATHRSWSPAARDD